MQQTKLSRENVMCVHDTHFSLVVVVVVIVVVMIITPQDIDQTG